MASDHFTRRRQPPPACRADAQALEPFRGAGLHSAMYLIPAAQPAPRRCVLFAARARSRGTWIAASEGTRSATRSTSRSCVERRRRSTRRTHGEVKVRIAATAVCHSDVHLIRGDWAGGLPSSPDMKLRASSRKSATHVTLAKPGDRVVVSLLRSCGRCFHCTAGATAQLRGRRSRSTPRAACATRAARRCSTASACAAFAEHAIVDQSQLVRASPTTCRSTAPPSSAAASSPASARCSTPRECETGESVVVIGTGGVGLNTIQGAVARRRAPHHRHRPPRRRKLEAAQHLRRHPHPQQRYDGAARPRPRRPQAHRRPRRRLRLRRRRRPRRRHARP